MNQDLENLLKMIGYEKADDETKAKVKELLKKIIARKEAGENEGALVVLNSMLKALQIDELDESAKQEIKENFISLVAKEAGFHTVKDFNFSFGGGFNNSFKGAVSETTATGDSIQGMDSNRIGSIYSRKKDAQGIFRQSPMPKKQDADEKKIEKQLQKIKDLFQSRNIKDVSISDIEKILQNESSPTTSTFSHSAWSGFKYIKVNNTGLVVHSNTFLCQAGTKLTKEKQDELQAMGVKIYFSESLNESTQNKNELIKALANLLEWAKGNRGSKSGNPYLFPEVKNALKVLGKIEGVNYIDVDTQKLSEGLLNEGKSKWTGKTDKGKKVEMGQDKSGMYYGAIRDRYGDIESSTLKKTKNEVDKWFDEHGIKKIIWDNKVNEAFNQFDSILDDISYDELRTVVFSNVESPDEKAVKHEFESLLKSKIKDARYELRTAAQQIVKEIENEYN